MKKILFFAIACIISAVVFAQTQHAKTVLNNKFKQHQTTKTMDNRFQHQGIPALEPNSLNYFPQKAIVYTWDNTGSGNWTYNTNKIIHYNIHAQMVYDLSTDTVTATPQYKDTSTYDLNGNQLSTLSQNWQLGAWVNSNRQTNTYDSQNNQTSSISESWQSGAWVISWGDKDIYQYDGNNNNTEDINQSWNTSTLIWENNYKSDMTFTNNILTAETDYNWQNSAWAPSEKYTNIVWLNFANFEPQSYTEQHWVNNAWTNYADFSATYTGNNYVSITDTIVNNNWVHSERETYTEDVNGGSVDLYELYQSGSWVNESRYSDYYDTHKNYTGDKEESWSSGSWTTTNQNNQILTYNGNIITERIYQYWDNTNLVLINSEKDVYSNFIQLDDGIATTISSNNDLQVYPNPFSTQTTISFTQVQKNTTIKIMDVLGNEVKTAILSGAKNLIIEKGELKAGIYIIQVIDENKNVMNKKIVVQ